MAFVPPEYENPLAYSGWEEQLYLGPPLSPDEAEFAIRQIDRRRRFHEVSLDSGDQVYLIKKVLHYLQSRRRGMQPRALSFSDDQVFLIVHHALGQLQGAFLRLTQMDQEAWDQAELACGGLHFRCAERFDDNSYVDQDNDLWRDTYARGLLLSKPLPEWMK